MAKEGSSTPERELLKLIEEPGQKQSMPAVSQKQTLLKSLSGSVIKSKLSFLKSKVKKARRLPVADNLGLRLINRILISGILILICYLSVDLTISIMKLKNPPNFTIEAKTEAASGLLPEDSMLKSVAFYLDKAKERDIFKMNKVIPIAKRIEEVIEVTPEEIVKASKALKVVGLSWSEDDPEVIIEDTDEKKAYFLKTGQKIGEFSVKKILKEEVILDYKGKEFKLQ